MDDVRAFREQQFVGSQTVVAASNVDHDELVGAVSELLGSLPATGAGTQQSKYFGGEVLNSEELDTTHVVVGFQGVSASDQGHLAMLVLRNLLGGNGTALKWSTDASASRIGAEVAKAVSGPFCASAFASSYSDTGLVGVQIATSNADTAAALAAAAQGIKAVMGGDFSAEDLAAAKAKLRLQLLVEGDAARTADMAAQILTTNGYATPEVLAGKVEAVTAEQVKAVAKQMTSARPVLAARGNIDAVAYLDTLGL
jgi:ubiquinol-cytochrome c reductase core subunit 2